MGSSALPLDGPGLATRRRTADDRVRSGTYSTGVRLGVSDAPCFKDSQTDGEVGLLFSMPPGLVGEVLKAAGESFGVSKALGDLLERGR
jgi:hypothetical protein